MLELIIDLNYYEYLKDLYEYLNLIKTSKFLYLNYNKDYIYKFFLEKKFSSLFTKTANQIIISYKDCYIRIIIFENILKKNGYELWDENIYYLFWKNKYYK